MQCVIPHQNLKILCRGLHSLARIGDELYVEPTQDGMRFRTVNAAQSAYSSLFFNLSFFSRYDSEFESEDSGTSKISMRACLRVFKTPNCMDRNVEFCKIEIDSECTKLIFQISFVKGYTKTHFLSINDNETIQLKYNKNEMCNNISILSRNLHNSIKHFGLKDEEITFNITNDKVQMRNYFESSQIENQKVVRTNLCLQRSEFETYNVSKPNTITFTLRELRAVCAFSESSNALVGIHFEMCGKPVIFTIESPLYQADYVISTLPPEMVSGERPYRRSQLSDVASSMPSTSVASSTRKRKLMSVNEELAEETGVEPLQTVEDSEPIPNCLQVVEVEVHRAQSVSQNTRQRSTQNTEPIQVNRGQSISQNTQQRSSQNNEPIQVHREQRVSQNTQQRSTQNNEQIQVHRGQRVSPNTQPRSNPNNEQSVVKNTSRCSFGPNDSDVNMDELMMKIDMNSEYFQTADGKPNEEEEISMLDEAQYDVLQNAFRNCFNYFSRECNVDDEILYKEIGD